jgi:heptosyltransferase-2
VPAAELAAWRAGWRLDAEARPIVTLSPGAVGAGKAWPPEHYAALAEALGADGASVWVLGGPGETGIARRIVEAAGPRVRDLTGADLRNAILAMAAADLAVTNDSGLMHVSAALGTPTVAIFGPTSPWHWKPLNPVAAILEPETEPEARQRARLEGNPAVAHHRTADVAVDRVLEAARRVLRGNADRSGRHDREIVDHNPHLPPQ